jgi:heptosyltransferase-2
MAGTTSVGEAIGILSVTDLLISNDMGLAHAAPAAGTPTIVIFGPTNSVTTRPFSGPVKIVNKNVDCSPCMLRDCPIDHRCMENMSADEIFAEARIMLDLHS